MILNVYKEQRNNRTQKYNGEVNSLELKKIKELIDIDALEYISYNVRNILKISKNNFDDNFKNMKNKPKNIFRVILYIRLSEEDGDLIDGDISKSIRNQLLLLLDECQRRKWKVVGIFCEEDISGADDNRPEWNKALKFCELKRTEIMLCKSQSRFSRSMEMIEKYLHKEFVQWGIRFVGLVDSTDTSIKGNKKARQINGLVNEWQVEDQSINTREILKNKKSLGLYATAWTPYGYIKNPKDKYQLIIDEEASLVVKRIFEEYINGQGCSKIAKKLNEERVPTTWEHKKNIGLNIQIRNPIKIIRYQTEESETLKIIADKFFVDYNEILNGNDIKEEDFISEENETCERILRKGKILNIRTRPIWNESAIRNILRNESYTGCLVLGKYQNKSYKDKTRIKLPKEEWIRVPHCHEAIIEREKWLMVNNQMDGRMSRSKPQCDGTLSEFSKKVFCECCGRSFMISSRIKNEEDNCYLKCGNTKSGKIFCDNKKTIKKSELREIVLEQLNEQIRKYFNLSKIQKNYYDKKVNDDINNEIAILEKEKDDLNISINKKTNLLSVLYEDRVSGVISTDEFAMLKNKNSKEIELANERIRIIEEKIFVLNERKNLELRSEKLFTKYKKVKELNRIIMNEFVDKIYIGRYDTETNTRNIKIVWNIKES